MFSRSFLLFNLNIKTLPVFFQELTPTVLFFVKIYRHTVVVQPLLLFYFTSSKINVRFSLLFSFLFSQGLIRHFRPVMESRISEYQKQQQQQQSRA